MQNINYNYQNIREGNIIKGRVIRKTDGKIYLDINYKMEGIIPDDETKRYDYYDKIKEGDEIEVMIKKAETEDGFVLLSKIAVDKRNIFLNIKKAYNEKSYLQGKVIRPIKGGYIVDFGANITAFLPMSHTKFYNGDILNKEVNLKIIQLDEIRKNIVVSYKDYFIEQQKKEIEEIKKIFPLNEKIRVLIKEIKENGIMVIKDNKEVFIPEYEIIWNVNEKCLDKFKIGEEIEALVINNSPEKLLLSIKRLKENPYKKFIEIHKPGEKVEVKIKEIYDDKIIVTLSEEVYGIIPINEISYLKKINKISDLYNIGDELKAVILKYEEQSNTIILSIKRCYENPWNKMEERYPPGARVIGNIKKIIEGQGIEVELEENINAFVNVKDISWFNFNKIEEAVKVGEKKEFKILEIDKSKFRLILGLKQLTPNPWNSFLNKYKEGMLIDVKIIDFDNAEIICQITEGVNGKLPLKTKNNIFKKGDIIKAKIIKIDRELRKVFLTSQEVEKSEEKKQLDEYIKTHEHSFKMNDIINFENVNKEDKK